MDLQIPESEKFFRDEVRTFLAENLTDDIRRAGKLVTSVFSPVEEAMAWQKILHKQGWAAPHWPEAFGGTGWSVSQRAIFAEELVRAETPPLVPMGLLMCGPCLIGCGTEQQKAEYLPKILNGEHFWCQGYSEPGSGSDLASLKTFAEKDGDDYIINGTKIWTTYAHHANRMFALVRTKKDGKPQQGITFLLLDMKSPGITVEPIVGLDEVPEQCQVWFDNVRVPQANRVGRENDGWTVAKYLLMFERGGQAYAPGLNVLLEKIRVMAGKQQGTHGTLKDDPVWQYKMASLEADILALEFTEMRIKSALSSGKDPGALASMTKILGTELLQKATELRIETLGAQALIWQPQALVPGAEQPPLGPEYAMTAMPHYLNSRACSIYGGSNEVQRGIIAKAVLGL
ncbi:acyl-CoA dehydrogenase family protein [Alcanivorax sp. 1008]|uniref:acyl-CoA dehydrogenase family protein n=1 Tax=Alcanivorax sp. 1008 TaxID=2816853 RepID=UPI001DC2D732|nr:acyl-CoA dehydrogenase family protein [Alcanivorax sp. 1008]MCC1495677.1 acyl-CoA dehydrogenase family protein [Alcanivorax sp. 1008]